MSKLKVFIDISYLVPVVIEGVGRELYPFKAVGLNVEETISNILIFLVGRVGKGGYSDHQHPAWLFKKLNEFKPAINRVLVWAVYIRVLVTIGDVTRILPIDLFVNLHQGSSDCLICGGEWHGR